MTKSFPESIQVNPRAIRISFNCVVPWVIAW